MEKDSAEKALLAAHEEIGTKAADQNLGIDLPAFGAVQGARAKLAEAQAALHEKEGAEQAARELLAAETQRHGQIITALEAEYAKLSADASDAKAKLGEVQHRISDYTKQIQKLQEAINAAGQGKPTPEPVDSLKEKLANLESARKEAEGQLPGAQERYGQAAGAAESKAAELKQARSAWQEAKAKGESAVAGAAAARKTAGTAVEASNSLISSAHRGFGRGLFEGGLKPVAIEASIVKAQALVDQIRDLDSRRAMAVAQAGALRRDASRFATLAGMVLLALIVIIVAVVFATRRPHGKHKPAGGAAATLPTAAASESSFRLDLPPASRPTTNP